MVAEKRFPLQAELGKLLVGAFGQLARHRRLNQRGLSSSSWTGRRVDSPFRSSGGTVMDSGDDKVRM